MTSSASSTGCGPSKTPVTGNPPLSKNAVASGPYLSDPIEGLSKAMNDQPQGSKTSKTSPNRTSSESSWLLAHPRNSFVLSENVTDGNRDSQQSTKAGTVNEGDNEYDNDSETIGPISKKHSSSRSSHTNAYTDCGRHSNDWLFKPMAKTAKTTVTKTVNTVFGTKEQK